MGCISKYAPLSVKYGLDPTDYEKGDFDPEGRLVTVEFDTFYLVCSYVPNAGAELDRLDYRTK